MKKQLKDVCEGFTKNIAQKDLSENNGKYPIFGASGIIKTIDFYISDKPYIGIVKDGSGVGRTNKYPAKSSLLGTMQYILPNQGIDLDYLMYGIRSLHLGENYSGAAIPHIYFNVYKNRTLDFPELAEQKQRSIVLNKIQDAINVKEKQLFELENIIQSEFVEMFGENPVESGKWKVEKLEDISTVQTGGTPSRNHPEYFEGNIPWVTTANLGKNELTYEDAMEYISQDAINNSATKIIPANSLFIGIRVGVGKCSINRVDMCSNQDICGLSGFDTTIINLVFLKKVLDSYSDFFENAKRGTTIKGIKSDTIKKLKIFIPELNIQNQFASFIQKIDKSKFVLQQQLQFIKKYVIMASWRKICFYTTVAM
ncbi:restriction endonuclease subunit S [Treponema succinifaciens]|uniref:restriction endonuclease subunit S n=1 Tax=Treponema succinifaciens TaxID=167 RepID=UPI002A7FDCA1|nr:restriction endonuclease subunit S [Treponema succinifaciens]MDY5117251.1 restriction endonuclease subunit S [Treponema succinifaciens]